MHIIVYHSYYGCDTGCCGHRIEVDGIDKKFFFAHAYGKNDATPPTEEELKEFARELVREEFGEEHVKDLDWENSSINTGCFR